MKKMFRTFCLASCIIGAVSCSQENVINPSHMSDDQINLLLSIESSKTRKPQLDETGQGQFSNGDHILLSFVDKSASSYVHKDFIVGSSNLKWGDLAFQGKPGLVSIAGCYPATIINSVRGNCIVDISTQDENADILLCRSNEYSYGTEQSISLMFNHAMHQLKIEYLSTDNTVSQEELEAITTTFTGISHCSINLMEGTVDKVESEKKQYQALTGNSVSFIVVPQSGSGITLQARILNKDYAIELPASTSNGTSLSELKSGYKTTLKYDVSQKDDQTLISFIGFNISGWEDGGIINDKIEI